MPTAIAPAPTLSPRVQLTARQRACLEQIARRQTSPQRLVRRAKLLLALETGANQCHVMRQMRRNRGTVHTWRQRWLALAPKLEQIIRRQTSPQRLVRRAKILLALETGANECHVMRQMHLNRGTVRAWRQRWGAFAPKLEQLEAEEGSDKTLCTMIVEALTDHPRPGTPATFTAEQIVQIVAVACEEPGDSGRPVSQWTPREVAEEVRKRGIVATISTRSVGRFLKSGRFTAPSRGILAQRQTG